MNPTQKSISWATTSPNPKKLKKKKKIQSNGQNFLINPSCLLPSKAVDNSRTLRVSLPNPHSLLSSHTHKPSSLSLLSLPSTPNSFLSVPQISRVRVYLFQFPPNSSMASSTSAQIHGLGISPRGYSGKLNLASSKAFFFGQKLHKTTAFYPKLRAKKVGPLRVVNEKVVGIDLGTTNSAVAAMEGGKPTIVTNAEGQRTTPSVVAYAKNGDMLVGQIAKRQAVVNPENTFFSVKRFIGRKMTEVDEESKQVSYRVVRDENGNVKLDCPAIGRQFAAEEISAQV